MAVSEIAFTMYPVSDLERAVAFYRDVLGLRPTEVRTDFWAEFEVAGATFGIGSFPQAGTPGTAQSLTFEVADLDGYRKTLTERGVEAGEPHQLQFCRIRMVKDPDGNSVWLHERKQG